MKKTFSLNNCLPFSLRSVLPWKYLLANSFTDLFSPILLVNEPTVVPDNVDGKDAGPLIPLSSRASPESGVLPADVFGLDPSLSKSLNSPEIIYFLILIFFVIK